ncbi:uncharacterized protein F5891DRAFT_975759 [Suillus fuscotomentosus]|uniref:C2H2-type domain-containing protein n=1 Tax=Suillus fuscotomentosus TaxID=1912939 RepID=A0AAD4EHV8_9AGAM|nr:uncharacterized protein F5891DRAFT_975759 [Suillus fuscotomentosus]KAG1906361.1 hypothetical protein F5891DRAFT_975759 [Suillus fuscotomentosus]
MSKTYICSAHPGCNATFTRFIDFKRHEATYSSDGYICTWPGCDFATKRKFNYEIHSAKHTGEQRYICPHDGCNYKTHDPAGFTRHRQKQHGYVALPRGRGVPSTKGSGGIKPSSQPPAQLQPPAEFLPPATFSQYQFQFQATQLQPMQLQPMLPQTMQLQPMLPQPMQLQPMPPQPIQLQLMQSQPIQSQPMPPQPMQSHPTEHKLQHTQYQTPPPIYDSLLGVLYGSTDTADDYTMYTPPARTSNGWTEGCMCPELMQRRPSEMLGYEY